MYSSFSGTYKLETDGAKLETDGARVVGRPVYVEQNKRDGDPFQEKNPARFMYCKEEEAWVFVHDRILQHEDDKEHSKCRWLMKSPKTKSFDLASVPLTGWSVWMGTIVSGETLIITCDECEQNTDCNSNGICEEGECKCKTKEYFGKHCEVEYPCEYMTDDDGNEFSLIETSENEPPFATSYGRPIYHSSIKEHDDEINGEKSFWSRALVFGGGRWFNTYFSAGSGGDIKQGLMDWLYAREFHSFWDDLYHSDIISDPTHGNDPIGVDFNRASFHGGDFKPFGLLTPIHEHSGQGFFHCQKDRCKNMEKGWENTPEPFNTCEIEFGVEISCIDSIFDFDEKRCVCSNGEVLPKEGFFCHLDAEVPSPDTMTTANEEEFGVRHSLFPTRRATSPAGGGRRLSDIAENDSCLGMERGDVAIIGMRLDNRNIAVFVALVDLPPGAFIYITTNAWTGTVFKLNGGTKKLQIPPSGIAAGTVFGYENNVMSLLLLATSWTIENGTIALSGSGGSFLMYCLDAKAKPSFLF